MSNKQIIGAGLAGLIAACVIKDAPIFEAGGRIEQHKALLRFRDKSVSEVTGIPFEEVTVNKEISFQGDAHKACTIAMANMYSRKVSGGYRGRSIWNLDTVKRYVAPSDLYDQLVERHYERIIWSCPVKQINRGDNTQTINTAPLPIAMNACGLSPIEAEFSRSAIKVDRYRLPAGTKVYQTIYFPDPGKRVFRASITGDLLIVESMTGQPRDMFDWDQGDDVEFMSVLNSFGLDHDDVVGIDSVDQKYGKIVELPRAQREAILYELTHHFNVFSIGRFATWRNILLDDVVRDIAIVERLMRASEYGRGLILSGR